MTSLNSEKDLWINSIWIKNTIKPQYNDQWLDISLKYTIIIIFFGLFYNLKLIINCLKRKYISLKWKSNIKKQNKD